MSLMSQADKFPKIFASVGDRWVWIINSVELMLLCPTYKLLGSIHKFAEVYGQP